ncbi:MAG: tRNA cyclic N6-threonylcarbamoyladenosine(37) synthase TcdA [Thiotrichales bacterium]
MNATLAANPVPDLARRFGGVARVYGDAGLARFARAEVAVVGVGGVGSWAVEALARSGIGGLTLIDLDHVCESNVNRQLPALDGNFGKAKTAVLAERVRAINPDCRVRCVEDFLTPENQAGLLESGFDWVVDCIDNARTKAALIYHCRRNKLKLVTVGGAGGMTDPTRIRVADLGRAIHDPLLAKTRRLLRQDYGVARDPKKRFDVACVFSEEQPVFADGAGGLGERPPAAGAALSCAGGLGSAVCVTAPFGFVAAAHVLRKLAASVKG